MPTPRKVLKKDIDNINSQFDAVNKSLSDIIVKIEPTMPLAAQSLKLSKEIITLYKTAYNASWNDVKQA